MDYEKGNPRNLVQFSEYSDLAFTDTGVKIDDNSGPDQNTLWTSEKIYQMINVPRPQLQQQPQLQPRPLLPQLTQIPHTLFNNAVQEWPKHQRPTNSFGEHHPHIPRVFKPKWWFSRLMHSKNHYCERCINYKDHFFTSKYKNNSYLQCTCDGCTKKKHKNARNIPQNNMPHNTIPSIPQAPIMGVPPMLSTLPMNFPQLRLPSFSVGPPMVRTMNQPIVG